ncbi:MAG: hypothetical protein KBH06_08165 [Spirochaetes bacterium]|nr:hypothetical protein [Spirochaetota bacterium]
MKIPKRIETIKRHIIKFEKYLQYEKRTFGCYDDGGGIRYVIGSYYMLAGDVEGALKHFKWFQRVFPDDCGSPEQYLSWTLALYKSGDLKKAYSKFLQTLLMNPFVIARVIGVDYIMPFEPGSNIPTKEWADWIADEIYNLWDEEAAAWAKESFCDEKTQKILNRYYEIEKQLMTEPVGETRSRLVKEKFAMMDNPLAVSKADPA